MNQPWTAEILISSELAKQLIESQFPALAPVQIERVGEGWDNVVYRVNGVYAFRFPRRQFGADVLEGEFHLLAQIADRLPLPIPKPLFLGHRTDDFRWPFMGSTYLAGQTACQLDLSDEERVAMIPALAQFMRALHSISEIEALKMGAQHDRVGRLDVADRWPKNRADLAKIKELGLLENIDQLLLLSESLIDVRDRGVKTLAHGDLYVRHLLVNTKRELCGVIDWGDLHIGNPAIDFQLVFEFLPPQAHSVFFDSYGVVDEDIKKLALFRALFHCSRIVVYSHDIGDEHLLRDGLRGLKWMAQQRI